MSAIGCSSQQSRLLAADKALEVAAVGAGTLVLDIDTQAQAEQYSEMFDLVAENCNGLDLQKETTSEGGNRHVYLSCDPDLDVYQRLVLMAILGSDPKHVLGSFLRAVAGDPDPVLAFEVPK